MRFVADREVTPVPPKEERRLVFTFPSAEPPAVGLFSKLKADFFLAIGSDASLNSIPFPYHKTAVS